MFQLAIKCVVCIMKMFKTKAVTEEVDPFSISRLSADGPKNSFPGPRADNAWCFYNKENVPKSAEEWNEVRYSFRCHVGYYAWPK